MDTEQDLSGLKETIAQLPVNDRAKLRDFITDSIQEEAKSPFRYNELIRELWAVTGKTIDLDDRKAQFVWARAMAAYQMLREGFTTVETGRQMGRDHSTVIHLRRRIQDALDLPEAYKDIVDIWKQFQKRLQI